MNQNVDLKLIEQNINEEIRYINTKNSQFNEKITSENREVNNLKRKLSSYSNSYIQNKKLSESVDLNQSRFESFLNTGKETQKELLSEVNHRKASLQRYRSMSKSFSSKMPIFLPLSPSQSEDSQLENYDFADLKNENQMSVFDKDLSKSTGRNIVEINTKPTSMEWDTKSLTEKYGSQRNIDKPKLSSTKSQNQFNSMKIMNESDKEINDNEFSIGLINQWQKKPFEEIPEVIEEASSANITPRRLEEENEEFLRLAEERRNGSPLFDEDKNTNRIYPGKILSMRLLNVYCIFFIVSIVYNVIVSKFNIDKEIELTKDVEMDISVLSAFNESEGENILNSHELSDWDISFTSANFQNQNNSQNISKQLKVPMLNLSKVKYPSLGGHQPIMSLNLSAISGNQSANDKSNNSTSSPCIVNPSFYKECKRSRNNEHGRYNSNNTYATTQNSQKKEDKSLGDSFIKDVNIITDIFDSQHTKQVSNLDLTFENEEKSPYEKTKLSDYDKEGGFYIPNLNFGSKRDQKSL